MIAPDSFKGTMSADDAAHAIADGWRERRPRDRIRLLPQADGGEGTARAIASALPAARWHRVEGVRGPDGRPVDGEWLELPDRTAVVELAQMSGITLMRQLDPDRATTFGFGEVIADALGSGAQELLLCLGGSASNDGGTGVLRALGVRLLDRKGHDIGDGAAGLDDLHTVDANGAPRPPVRGVNVLTDVTAPLLGPRGATAVFGSQKGIHDERRPIFERRLEKLSGAFPQVMSDTPGMGAAGGTAFGLAAIWDAAIASGARHVATLTGLVDAVGDADLLVTGEGRFDDQSRTGKVVGALTELAGARGVPVAVVAGTVRAAHPGPVIDLARLAGSASLAMAAPTHFARLAGAELASNFL